MAELAHAVEANDAGRSNQDADSRLDTCLLMHDFGSQDKCNLQVIWTSNTLKHTQNMTPKITGVLIFQKHKSATFILPINTNTML